MHFNARQSFTKTWLNIWQDSIFNFRLKEITDPIPCHYQCLNQPIWVLHEWTTRIFKNKKLP